ncbi:hypothetical protein B0T26DRAFT_701279 [Lasiosphaeria miniovina]|uniref:Uncharacterized protein n=1 Tax=Lasiosphaeria miniovina TaxID=1954250 RepID=A0AA40DZA8_9PEZI|nr:uncharacterized protein B0T26DRAFT_701279 [Lasiosphaeria miniovina]KAK0722089.1 hypothetical protein B0T26DRAFT_701279 [Lasiosphaeria miniovina]
MLTSTERDAKLVEASPSLGDCSLSWLTVISSCVLALCSAVFEAGGASVVRSRQSGFGSFPTVFRAGFFRFGVGKKELSLFMSSLLDFFLFLGGGGVDCVKSKTPTLAGIVNGCFLFLISWIRPLGLASSAEKPSPSRYCNDSGGLSPVLVLRCSFLKPIGGILSNIKHGRRRGPLLACVNLSLDDTICSLSREESAIERDSSPSLSFSPSQLDSSYSSNSTAA